jgi:beta-glucanase (GH16 family)
MIACWHANGHGESAHVHESVGRSSRSLRGVTLTVCTFALLLFAASLATLTGTSRAATPRAAAVASMPLPPALPGNWQLVLNSTFNGSSLNRALWRPGWFGNGITGPIAVNELACYSPENVTFPGDDTMHLNLTETPSTCEGRTRPATGAVVSTNPNDGRQSGGFQYRYGFLEARVYIPAYQGRIAGWPVVMALGQVWPQDGEDDVLEGLYGNLCVHFHSPGYANNNLLGGCYPRFSPGWHTIASDWQPGSIAWYYDGALVKRVSVGITSAPMYIVLANTLASFYPHLATPDSMRVAYVRVWQLAGPLARRLGYMHSY